MELSELEIKLVYDGLWAVNDGYGVGYGAIVPSATNNGEWVFLCYDNASLYYGPTREAAVQSWLDS